MTAPLDRVRHLLAKAVDEATTEEEARTCALIAARLIVEHRMLEIPRPPPMPPMKDFQTIWQEMQEMFQRQRPYPGEPKERWTAPARPRRRHVEPTYPKPPREPPWWERLPSELLIVAERKCSVCGLPCEEGSVVWAYAIPDGRLGSLLVAHLKGCRDKLTPAQRRPGTPKHT